jgi:5-methyltetrahydrofolate--homocysteine methyltransferase
MSQMELIYQAVLGGDLDATVEGVQTALGSNLLASDILEKGLIAPMAEVGRLFEDGEFFVPEMLVAARAMKAGLEILRPMLADSGVEPVGKVIMGTVKGDLHDIGKNLVSMMLEGAGFEIMDLGTDVAPEKFVEAIIKQGDVDIVGLSALLTTTMPSMESTIKAIGEAGLRERVKVMVGGAPVTAEYARNIGADGFAPDAGQAVTLAKSLMLMR